MNNENLTDSSYIVPNGREVYKWAVKTVPIGMLFVINNASINLDKSIGLFL